jgi:hypothetical protein
VLCSVREGFGGYQEHAEHGCAALQKAIAFIGARRLGMLIAAWVILAGPRFHRAMAVGHIRISRHVGRCSCAHLRMHLYGSPSQGHRRKGYRKGDHARKYCS